jgi:hypothetical protein
MKILYLYYMMKLNGPEFHRARLFTDRLREKHRVDMKYVVLPDADYDRFNRADPGFPELISSRDFLNNGYDCVIVDDRVYENDTVSFRIPRETLKSFHDRGGIVFFLFGDQDSIRHNKITLEEFAKYLGACNHGHGGLFQSDPSTRIIKGVQRGDSHLVIEITPEYLSSSRIGLSISCPVVNSCLLGTARLV